MNESEITKIPEMRILAWLAALSPSLSCNGAADGLAKAIVCIQIIGAMFKEVPEIVHQEWLEVKNNQVTIHVNVMLPGHIGDCEVTMSVGSL